MFQANDCTDVVSIIEAIFFGADGACIDVGITSLLGGVALFIGAVVVLRFIGSALLRQVSPSRSRPSRAVEQEAEEGLKPLPYESPIKSTGAWGREQR